MLNSGAIPMEEQTRIQDNPMFLAFWSSIGAFNFQKRDMFQLKPENKPNLELVETLLAHGYNPNIKRNMMLIPFQAARFLYGPRFLAGWSASIISTICVQSITVSDRQAAIAGVTRSVL